MGKASSAKKVARAARVGGGARRERRQLGFPMSIFMILVIGSLLVVYARTSRDPAGATEAPSYIKKDHWHQAYGVYVCDHYLPALPNSPDDPLGIHTHGDGIIHVHPFGGSASGSNAKLSKFDDIKWTDEGFRMPDGTEYKNGHDCSGKPANVHVYRWKIDDPTSAVEVFDKDWANIRFTADREAYSIAVIPSDVEPPPLPDSVPGLNNLSDLEPGQQQPGGTPSIPGQEGVPGQPPIIPGQPGVSIESNPGVVPPSSPAQPGNPVDPANPAVTPSDPSVSIPPTPTPTP